MPALSAEFIAPINHSAKVLVSTMYDEASAVQFPIMPIVVKTPDCPMVIVPPSSDTKGAWHFDIDDNNVVGKFLNDQNKLNGFILLGRNALSQRMQLVQQMAG